MARLILEEGGATRRFKLSSGKLTFGSGEKATLKLESDDVAALHGQIEMSDDGAILRVAKGVTAPKVGGKPVSGAHTMRAGQPVAIGGAKITVEYDPGEGPAEGARVAAAPAGARAGVSAGSGSGSRGRVQRQRPQAKKSAVPTWLIVVGVLGLIGGTAYAILGNTADNMAGNVFSFDVQYAQYQRLKTEDPIGARAKLREIAQEELSIEQRKAVEAELATSSVALASVDETVRNASINTWLQSRILNYSEKFPVTEKRSYARLFLKRCDWFLEEYPTHPERARVERLVERVTPVAELSEPAEFEDLRIEVKGFTDVKPMDFPVAFKAIDKFVAETSDPDEADQAEALRKETRAAERAFYELKLNDAAVVYDKLKYPDKYAPNTAFDDMVRIITAVEDPELKADAGRRILGISELDAAYFRGYQRGRPDAWEKLMTVPALLEYAKNNGLEK